MQIIDDYAAIDEIVNLWRRCGLLRPWNDPINDIQLARADNGAVLCVLLDNKLIGAAMVGHDGHRGAVYYLGIDPEYQKSGFGRALMNACEDWVRAHNIPKINLLVRRENQGVLDFYQGLGFEDTNSICLYKNLNPEQAQIEKSQKANWCKD